MRMQTQNNNRIPGPGDNSNLFERLSYYISNIDKDWINRIQPASEEEISLLKKLSRIEESGFDIPESYKIFLKYMGKDDGGAFSGPILRDISINDIIDLYKDIHDNYPEELNPNYLAFATTDVGEQISFDLTQQNELNIIKTYEGEFTEFFSESFEKLLFQSAFIKYERKYYSKSIAFGGSKNMLNLALSEHKTKDIFEVVDCYAKKFGFEKAWFSDKRQYFGIREDTTFYVYKDSGVAGIITGNNGELLEKFASDLVPKIGTTIHKREGY